jgi:hypothetical protein
MPLVCSQIAASETRRGRPGNSTPAICAAFVVIVSVDKLSALRDPGLKLHVAFAGSPVQVRLIAWLNVAPTDGTDTM